MKKIILLTFLCFGLRSQSPYKIGRFEIDDVALHVDGTALISCGISQITYNITDKKGVSILTGFLSGLTVSIVGKEIIYDKILKRGVYSVNDIHADIWGAVVSVPVMICKFDFDETGLIPRKKHEARRSKFNRKKYILD